MLFSQDNRTFKYGYELLINRMMYLGWLSKVFVGKELKYKIDNYAKFETWFLSQQRRRFDRELYDLLGEYAFRTIIYLPRSQ
jgi:hypothetical protein